MAVAVMRRTLMLKRGGKVAPRVVTKAHRTLSFAAGLAPCTLPRAASSYRSGLRNASSPIISLGRPLEGAEAGAHARGLAFGQGRGHGTTCRALKTGIVGLPNVGKSTLFNALVEGSQAQAANFPFCTIEPNVGTVPVPDQRLHQLSELSKSKSTVATTIEFVDIAGLVAGASKGEGLGNKFLSHIREVDAIVHVVRCFEDTNVVHVDGSVDPLRDTEVIETELALSDMAQIERRFERLKKGGKGKKAPDAGDVEAEKKILETIYSTVEQGIPARKADLEETDFEVVKGLGLLTMKPVIYAANVAEDDLMDEAASNPHAKALRKKAEDENARFVLVSAKMEEELVELSGDERQEFLEGFGIKQTGLQTLIKVAYDMLGLRTYFTSGEKETRAWTIVSGMTAPEAAGVIHTDFTKGFIRAETISYDDFVTTGSQSAAKEKGLLRSEGKEYVVQEGDVILFRFNV
ncbi:ribosome-binding ATPase YchF [Chloropicon primus]|uniref:Obg-like ATPase 1 n=2 Tax=Chloropicon primus TaxID=1764295 RepID=A0A5B8MPQ4_9CHLO|nr:ribosome-binding ATPase YchF [Chloropicon primus]UPR00556.1 ribosome-binding ATPase YchF [Chloropicon primus]|eukprot:QDZ21340.1 ribosome-binding ATPase YchF [Chloropicon primus]